MTKEQFEAQQLKTREEPERKMEKYVSCPIRKSTCRRDCAFRSGFDMTLLDSISIELTEKEASEGGAKDAD